MVLDFDFDEWAELAKRDTEAFEVNRREAIEQLIEERSVSSSRRLLDGLQFRIDMERHKSKNPMGSCICLSRMMMEQFYSEFHPAVSGTEHSENEHLEQESNRGGEVIPLRKRGAFGTESE